MRFLLAPFQYLLVLLANLLFPGLVCVLASVGLRRLAFWFTEFYCRISLFAFGARLEVRGLENVPSTGSCVIVSSHSSHLDGPALIIALPHPIYFIIKRELAEIPVWGSAAKKLGFISVDRGRSEKARAQMREAIGHVQAGRRVLVFAEGTRSPNADMLPFKKGGFHLAVDAQVPILPIAIKGGHAILPKRALLPHPGPMEVVIGEPIPTEGLTKVAVPELLQRTRAVIEEMRE